MARDGSFTLSREMVGAREGRRRPDVFLLRAMLGEMRITYYPCSAISREAIYVEETFHFRRNDVLSEG